MKALFETVAVPLASPGVPGVAYRGLRTVAFDGLNSVKVPDSDRNRSWLGKKMTQLGIAGYPALRIVALAETGTRGLLGAVTGGKGERSEVPLARKLVPLLREGMLLLADRAYDAADLLKEGTHCCRGAFPGPAAAPPALASRRFLYIGLNAHQHGIQSGIIPIAEGLGNKVVSFDFATPMAQQQDVIKNLAKPGIQKPGDHGVACLLKVRSQWFSLYINGRRQTALRRR